MAQALRKIKQKPTTQNTNLIKITIMKKFSVAAILAMGVLTVSSAAFAGTTAYTSRGWVGTEVNDTIVPTDTVVPEKQETTTQSLYTEVADTVLPTDTVVPEKQETTTQSLYTEVADTVLPTDTVVPEKQETTTQNLYTEVADTVLPTDTVLPEK